MDRDASSQSFALGLLEVCIYRAVRRTPGKFAFEWSGSCLETVGYSADQLADEGLLKQLLGGAYQDWLYHLDRAMEQNICYQWEHPIHLPEKRLTVRHKLGRMDASTVVGTLQHVPQTTFDKDVALQLEVLEHLPVGIYFIDPEYRIQWTNQLGTCQSHINWKNHYGEVCYRLPFGRETHCENCPVVRSLVDGERMTNELAMPNGKTWLLSAMPTYNRQGKRIGAVEVVTDVSDIAAARNASLESLKRHETQLREQNRALMSLHSHPDIREGELEPSIKAIAETAAKILNVEMVRFWMNDTGEYVCIDEYNAVSHKHYPKTGINERFNRIYEVNFELKRQITIDDTLEADLPEDMAAVYARYNIRSVLYCPIRLRGNVVGAIAMADSKPRKWTVEDESFGSSLADFTALLLGLSELQESQRTMKTLLSNLPGMAFRLRSSSAELAFEFASEGSFELTGFKADELLNNKSVAFLSLVYPDDQGQFVSIHRTTGNDDHPRENMFRIIRKDGEIRWVWERSRIVSRTGDAVVFEGFFHDVTERFQLQEAELANKTKTEFMATMSHEIRTPMNAILGLSHQVLKTALSDKQCDYIRKIHSAANHLMGIINDILVYSKIEAGKMLLEDMPFRVCDLMSTLEAILGHKAADKGLKMQFHVSGSVPDFVRGDSLRISQVLNNLLSNAIKFTEHGKVDLHVAMGPWEDGFGMLGFTVSDTGIGISSAQEKMIFDPFCQGDASITRKYGGTGLGLSISKKLAEHMHGDIVVSSVEGRGTDMTFTCRVGKCDMDISASGESNPGQPHFDGQKVLVVEDNPVNQEIATELLSDVNLKVTVANNGQEALDILRDSEGRPPFSMVLMDLQMPVMDGYQAARLIRNDPRYDAMPVIAMTAHALDSERERCIETGMNGHLTKPVDIQAMYAVLKAHLGAVSK